MNKEELWQAVLAQIQLNTSAANFNTWFKNTSILSIENGKIVVSTPNAFVREWLEQKYNKIILKILRELNQEAKEIEYIIGRQETKVIKNTSTNQAILDQPIFPELKVDKETNLNPRYTFENFIVGSFNELAQAAAWAVAKNPGKIYNPLFIYGGVGLGKTHLLQAIGNAVVKNPGHLKVKYIPTERFTSEVVSAIRNHSIENLKLKYREIDILILDDVQFLAGKEKTQEEFFHTFNALYEKNKQIVLSSDRPPKAIPALAERLRSRFEGGMIADIGYPDFETRLAILKQKSQERKINLSEEILSYIASKIQKNIRELEGALNRIIASQQLGETVTLESVKNILKSFFVPQNKITTPKKIIQAVANFYDLKEKDLLSPSRRKEVVKPRQIITYLLRENLKCSFPYIGQKIGGKDHTTALHAYRKIVKEIKNNENLRDEIELINQIISSL